VGDDVSARKRPLRRWTLLLFLAAGIVLVGVVAIESSGGPAPARPAPTPPVPAEPAPAPPAAWLGLNYNSGSNAGEINDFAVRGIVYDRAGSIEVEVGDTPENAPWFRTGLDTSYAAQMIPDIEVDPATGPPGCYDAPDISKTCLPTSETEIRSLIQGFVQTAGSVLRDYPGKRVLFEPLDEPWDWASPPGTEAGKLAAAEYATILAQLLPAGQAAGIPLSDIYVAAIGKLPDGTSWVPDLYKAQPCLKPGPATCGPIAGWYLHPYGLPHSSTGIESVPGVRAEMLSGQGNIILSEIGFCATDVDGGKACDENSSNLDGTSSETAIWLSETLQEAGPMHRAGWLKALLVWERSGSGWAMQNPDGSLTDQGRVLDLFADSPAGH
jgi:hypothetical protein